MQPGENRWLGIHFPAAAGDPGQQLTVNFFEVSGGVVVNGFAMGARLGVIDAVIAEKLRQLRSVFGRIGAGWQIGEAEEIAAQAGGHIDARQHGEGEFLEYLRRILPTIDRILRQLVESDGRRDVFALLPGVRNLEAALGSGDAGVAAVALSCLLNRTDSWLTMLQLQLGDVADILQNVRWQRAIFMNDVRMRRLSCAREVIARGDAFIVAYGKRQLTNQDYPGLLAESSDCFAEASRLLPQLELVVATEAIRHAGRDLRRLQRAHAELLGRLQHSHAGS
jgi:hypothetical protein